MNRVAIGIQARSTSKRFPDKMFAKIGKRSALQCVVDSCQAAATYLNNWSSQRVFTEAALLIPQADPISEHFKNEIYIIEGSEDDVLSRYMMLLDRRDSDYICRVTGDCPLIPPYVISKMITLAITNKYDYVSNVDERCRTTLDGWDCEVISKRALEFADSNHLTPTAREHVTLDLRVNPPSWLNQGTVVNFIDLSSKKLSLDTEADLEAIQKEYEIVQEAYEKAVFVFGKKRVHRW